MSTLPQDLLAIKRDGLALGPEALGSLVAGLSDGSLADAQVGALAMAIRIQGMTALETVQLTLAMRDSGQILNWEGLPGPVLDKHSTGGLGDKVSLALAPIVASCGAFVPMISGRGLGHTGGTLDKLESIPDLEVMLDPARLQALVRDVGCAIVGAGDDLAPADRRLYAIRDVTATVDSLPLITASILAKKLAAGTDALLMDVKVGNGAFLPSLEAASALAASLETVANGAGLACKAVLTDMNQCLGQNAGNALEVIEALDLLAGRAVDERFRQAVVGLAAELVCLGGLEPDLERALGAVEAVIQDGLALKTFARMVAGQGGPADLADRPAFYLPKAPVVRPVLAKEIGWITAMDVRRLGMAIVAMGGGRTRPDAAIDPAVGFSQLVQIGQKVEQGQPLCLVHARCEADLQVAASEVELAVVLADRPPAVPPRLWWTPQGGR